MRYQFYSLTLTLSPKGEGKPARWDGVLAKPAEYFVGDGVLDVPV